MKARKGFVSLLAIAGTSIVFMGNEGGCGGGLCPDLYVACPDLECENGFKVDKGGCAICECVGDVTPVDESCKSNADCGEGQYCEFSMYALNEQTRCAGGFEGDGAESCVIPPVEGVCRDIQPPPPSDCSMLDEWSCQNTFGCEPVYETFDTCMLECACLDEDFDGLCDDGYNDCCYTESYFAYCQEASTDLCHDDGECPEGFRCNVGYTMNGNAVGVCVYDYGCPVYDWMPCEGITIPGGIDEFGCQLPPTCVESCIGLSLDQCETVPACMLIEEEPCACAAVCFDEDRDGECDPCECPSSLVCVERPVDPVLYCSSDADCPEGMACEGMGLCPEGAECEVQAVCVVVDTGCEGLDEQACVENRSCQPVYTLCAEEENGGCQCQSFFVECVAFDADVR